MASWEPTERIAVPSSQQAWEALTFVHFAYDPAIVERLLPAPLEPDLFDGHAWVGITPFRLRAAVLPALRGPRSTYVEVNVRTYVRHPSGRDGIWFLSLDLDQAVVSAGLRLGAGLPYRRAETRIEETADAVSYVARRRRPHRKGSLRLQTLIGERMSAPPGVLETFLVGRWRAFSRRAGQLFSVPVAHQPWPLSSARLAAWESNDFLEELGLPERPREDAHVMFSPGVEARLGFPRREGRLDQHPTG